MQAILQRQRKTTKRKPRRNQHQSSSIWRELQHEPCHFLFLRANIHQFEASRGKRYSCHFQLKGRFISLERITRPGDVSKVMTSKRIKLSCSSMGSVTSTSHVTAKR